MGLRRIGQIKGKKTGPPDPTHADPQCLACSMTLTSDRVPAKTGTERKWPHSVHIAQLTRQHTVHHSGSYVQTQCETICSDNRVSTVRYSYQNWETLIFSWLNVSECIRNKHNAATGIISGSADTGQCLFLC